jgi:ribose transport system permease protein
VTLKKSESKRLSGLKVWKVYGPFVIFLLLLGVVVSKSPGFLSATGFGTLTQIAAPILMVALGQALILNIGLIDLSNAALSLLGAILLAVWFPHFGVLTPFVLLIATTLMGACNGFLVAYTKVPAFALTLGTFGIFQTGALVSSQATAVYVDDNDSYLGHLNNKTIIGTPLIFYVGVFVAILLWVFLRFIKDGRSMTTIGLNEIGSYYSGLRGKRTKILAFALSGFMSGLAGITIIAQSGSASPNGLGSDLLLPGIAAAIVGGTSILGGVTNPINVVFGSLIISMIPIVNSILGVTTQAQSLVYGLAIIVVAAGMLNTLKNMTVK